MINFKKTDSAIGNVIFAIFSTVCSIKASINISKFGNIIKSSYCVQLTDINHTFFNYAVS